MSTFAGQQSWDRTKRQLATVGDMSSAGSDSLDDVEQFSGLVLCVFGDLSVKRNEHLFLKTLCLIMRREMYQSSDSNEQVERPRINVS